MSEQTLIHLRLIHLTGSGRSWCYEEITPESLEMPKNFYEKYKTFPVGTIFHLVGDEGDEYYTDAYLITSKDDNSKHGVQFRKMKEAQEHKKQYEEEYALQSADLKSQISVLNKQLRELKKPFDDAIRQVAEEINIYDEEVRMTLWNEADFAYNYETTRRYGIKGDWEQ